MKTSEQNDTIQAPETAPKFGHTPGPWEHLAGSIGTHKFGLIAMMPPKAESAANARLIAAAPELLAALQAAVEYLHANRPKGKVRDIFSQLNAHENGVLKPARAAIAKATGGSL